MKKIFGVILPLVLLSGFAIFADDQVAVAPAQDEQQAVTDERDNKFLSTLKDAYDKVGAHEKIQAAIQAAADSDATLKADMLTKYGQKMQDGTVVIGIPVWFVVK
ncbi:TPA: hypothetical protein DDZ86_00260 [Candidatus Dependentiae bacterium]|nr:MAG: hypothetical protein UW09_C0002G0070 [candidate division TM6 bacterium GW2011_GWF2_43_87]HBL98061.1 hypothetical protein [Candidatus Dependentiae bacterium]